MRRSSTAAVTTNRRISSAASTREIENGSPEGKNYQNQKGRRKTLSKYGSIGLIEKRFHLYIRRNRRKFLSIFAIILVMAVIVTVFISISVHLNLNEPSNRFFYESQVSSDFDIVFTKKRTISANMVNMPKRWGSSFDRDYLEEDYGGIDVELFEEDTAVRNIYHDPEQDRTDYRNPDDSRDDDVDLYYAFDDDFIRDKFEKEEDDGYCRRVSVHRLSFPTCNNYHEISFIDSHAKYLNAGTYRQVMVADHSYYGGETEQIILKDIWYEIEATQEHYEYVRMDALIAERLTTSPRIYDIYTMCGLGIISEFFPHGDMEDLAIPDFDVKPEKPYDPKNDFTPIEKLEISKQMAEAVADLHGFSGGVMVHQDIQLSQFLFNKDKSLVKLNDFNRAEFLLWDEEEEKYCLYHEGRGMGNWRSAEEYFDRGLTEKVDVFSLGNNMFGVLLGVTPFWDVEHEEEVQEKVKNGEKAPIDPSYKEHSFAERKLVELIDWCHDYDPKDRPSIFEVVEFLSQAIIEAKERTDET